MAGASASLVGSQAGGACPSLRCYTYVDNKSLTWNDIVFKTP
jgi:hypothetical protein